MAINQVVAAILGISLAVDLVVALSYAIEAHVIVPWKLKKLNPKVDEENERIKYWEKARSSIRKHHLIRKMLRLAFVQSLAMIAVYWLL